MGLLQGPGVARVYHAGAGRPAPRITTHLIDQITGSWGTNKEAADSTVSALTAGGVQKKWRD